MTENRTDDWLRIRSRGFLLVEDQPGKITVRNSMNIFPAFRVWLPMTLAIIALWLGIMAGWEGFLIGGGIGVVFTLYGLLHFWLIYGSRAHKVEFTADRLTFYGVFGGEMGSLAREAMQQIAVEEVRKEKPHVTVHNFIADTGWIQAMPTHDKYGTGHRNNILLAAFNQPVHLDLMVHADTMQDYAPDIAPQIHDLKPVE